MLDIDRLSTRYGAVKALDDVTIHAPDGSITALLGANGAGKTTLLRTVTGLVASHAGKVTFGDHDLTHLSPEAIASLGVAHVPEGGAVVREFTVDENLRLGGLLGYRRGERAHAANEIYSMFPALRARQRSPAFTLSGGERQMLAIGRALMTRPRVLLLDEPSLGLAPLIVAQLMSLLRQLRDERGLSVLLVEQNARSALSVADRAIVLNLGRVVKVGDAASVAADEDLRHAYLGF